MRGTLRCVWLAGVSLTVNFTTTATQLVFGRVANRGESAAQRLERAQARKRHARDAVAGCQQLPTSSSSRPAGSCVVSWYRTVDSYVRLH